MVEAIATILLVIFAGRQLGSFKEAANAAKDNAEAAKDAAVSTKRYVEMTEQMVEVARQSARAAKLALRADRPALVIKFVVPEYKETAGNTSTVSGEIYLQNLGKGPAVITKAVSALRVQQKDLLSLEPPDHSQCSRSWIDQPVVSPATTVIMGLSNSLQLSSREFEHVAKLRWTIVAYGRLSYRDPAFEEEEYEMVFQWIYRPPKEEKPDGDFLLGYAEHQRWK